MDEQINVAFTIPGEALACKALDIILEFMRGATPEQKATVWAWYIEDIGNFRAWVKSFKP